MTALAQTLANDVAKAVPVSPEDARVIDIGGGHAVYSPRCSPATPGSPRWSPTPSRRWRPDATMWPPRRSGPGWSLHAADVLTDDLPEGFDLALLLQCRPRLPARRQPGPDAPASSTLRPGGRVVILEQIHGVSPMPLGRAALNLLSLSYFHLLGGQVHSFEDIRSWLGEAGFIEVERRNVMRAGSAVITARRPD